MPTLECHSRGDIRFSPFGAVVSVNGVSRKIEDHYQSAKVFEGSRRPTDWRDAREMKRSGLRQVGWNIGGMTFFVRQFPLDDNRLAENDLGVQFYCLLWAKYLKANPQLVEEAKRYDTFRDPFAGNFPFSQAEVLKLVATHPAGVNALLEKAHELLEILRAHNES